MKVIFCLLTGVAFAFPRQKFDSEELKNGPPAGTPTSTPRPDKPRPPTTTPRGPEEGRPGQERPEEGRSQHPGKPEGGRPPLPGGPQGQSPRHHPWLEPNV